MLKIKSEAQQIDEYNRNERLKVKRIERKRKKNQKRIERAIALYFALQITSLLFFMTPIEKLVLELLGVM